MKSLKLNHFVTAMFTVYGKVSPEAAMVLLLLYFNTENGTGSTPESLAFGLHSSAKSVEPFVERLVELDHARRYLGMIYYHDKWGK